MASFARSKTHDEDLPIAFDHRNAPPPYQHVKVGITSEEVEAFENLQIATAGPEGKINLGKMFPADQKHGWHGFVDFEGNPEMAAKAEIVLKSHEFTQIPEFQMVPLPNTNPMLIGNRWKEAHIALGPHLENMPEESWKIKLEEKSPDMLTVLDFPLNCEPKRVDLMKNYITPNNQFYVRNHGGIPTIADEDYVLTIGGLIKNAGTLTLAQLKDPALFPQIEMPITLQCCGTRRVEQIAYAAGEGDELLSAPWAEGAIGSAVWKGVSLKKVIKYFGGVTQDFTHVEGIGADTYFKKNKAFNYAVSVPYTKVRVNEVILAYEMNGEPLPKSHGGPLRMVVAGYIGARSTKWLIRLNILPEPSLGPVQRQEYLYFNHQIGKHNSTYSAGFSIQTMPVSSAILFPADNEVIVHDGFIDCSGWCYSGSGWIERVEVSGDGGFTYYQVPLENMSPKHLHTKRLWHMKLPMAAEGWRELVVRCWDDACNTQPATVRDAWNWTLHVTSHSQRIKVYSMNATFKATKDRIALLAAGGDSIFPLTRPVENIVTETPEAYAAAMLIKGPREPRS